MNKANKWITKFIPVIACKDDSGHWYVIPAEMGEEFNQLLEKSTDFRIDSAIREVAESDFIDKFSEYMTGGDLNLTQLYMKVEPLEQEIAAPIQNPFLNPEYIEQLKKDNSEFYKKYVTGEWDAPKKRGPDIDEHGIAGPSMKCGSPIFTPKKSALEMVEEFHQAFNCPVYKTPVMPAKDRHKLRYYLMEEELHELNEAMWKGDMVKILDGLCDLLYVVYGTAHEFGLGPVLNDAIAEVHRSNMSKLGADGKPIYREDGKVLKGPNFTPPDLAAILNMQKAKEFLEKVGEIDFKQMSVDLKGFKQDTYPEWNQKAWREACSQAKKDGFPEHLLHLMHYAPPASLGADLPEMPEPANKGVIYSDLKKEPPTLDELAG